MGSYITMKRKPLEKLIQECLVRLDADRETIIKDEVKVRAKAIWNKIHVWQLSTHATIEAQVRRDVAANDSGLYGPDVYWRYQWHRAKARKILRELGVACQHSPTIHVSTADLREITC